MTISQLKGHYDSKYAHEAQGQSTSLITGWEMPTDRFKAAVWAAHAYFKGGSILELGSGNGGVSRTLLATLPGLESYVASDWSEARVTGLRNGISDPRASVIQLDAEDIPSHFAEKFDAIIMVALIEHLIDPMSAMSKIRHALKPGGWVYVDTPNVAKWTRRLKLLAGQFPSTASRDEGLRTYEGGPVSLYDEGHLHYFTFRSLERMLKQYCGFSRVERVGHYVGRFPLGDALGFELAKRLPTLLSDATVVAYR